MEPKGWTILVKSMTWNCRRLRPISQVKFASTIKSWRNTPISSRGQWMKGQLSMLRHHKTATAKRASCLSTMTSAPQHVVATAPKEDSPLSHTSAHISTPPCSQSRPRRSVSLVPPFKDTCSPRAWGSLTPLRQS